MSRENRTVYILTSFIEDDCDDFYVEGAFWDLKKARETMMAKVHDDDNFDEDYKDEWEINDFRAESDPNYDSNYRSTYAITSYVLPYGKWDDAKTIYYVVYESEYEVDHSIRFVSKSKEAARSKWHELINNSDDFKLGEDETVEDLGIFIDENDMYANSNNDYDRDWDRTTIIYVKSVSIII